MAGPQCTSCFPFPFLTDCGNGKHGKHPPFAPSYPILSLKLLDQRPIDQPDHSELSAEQHRLHVYGTLGFGLLTGAFKPGHAFDKGDWRNNSSTTFWLPLFQRDNFEREVRVGK